MPTNLLNVLALGESDGFMMPSQSSSIAGDIDLHFYIIFWVATFFFVLIISLVTLFAFRYRRKAANPNPPKGEDVPHHNTKLEIVWSIIPLVGVIAFFAMGFAGYVDLRTPPPESYTVNVTAYAYGWSFSYPTGQEPNVEEGSGSNLPILHLPPNEPIHLRITSRDYLHALFIPAMRVKMDAVAGRYSDVWFTAEPGTYRLFCAEYCGTGHSTMHTLVVVHESREDFNAWLATVKPEGPFHERGEKYVYLKRGCNQCHSVDGSQLTGPSFLGLWGRTEQFTDGSSLKVEGSEGIEYIRESIYNPQDKIVAGYEGVKMQSFRGLVKDEEILWFVEYLKWLDDPEAYEAWLKEQGGAIAGEEDGDEDEPVSDE